MPHAINTSPAQEVSQLRFLRRLDMNLLLTFDALMKTRSATESSRVLHKTQPAISRDLARLRERLSDPLLVVTKGRFVPTERALDLHSVVREALARMEAVLSPPVAFDPSAAEGTINIGTGAHIELLLAAPFLQRLRAQAPGVIVRFQSVHGNFQAEELDSERMDIAVGLFHDIAPRFHHCELLRDRRVCVVSADHPMANRKRLSLDDLARLTWFAVTNMHGRETAFDRALKPLHRQMSFSAYLSGFGIAPEVLMHTDYATTMPACVAEQHLRHFPLATLAMPSQLRSMVFSMVWAKRQDTSPLHAWVRSELLAVVDERLPKHSASRAAVIKRNLARAVK